MKNYSKQALKLTLVLSFFFLGLVGALSLILVKPSSNAEMVKSSTPYHYARQTWIRHEYWVWFWGYWVLVRKWGLYTNCKAYYMTSQGYDIYDWDISGSGAVIYASDWVTMGYTSDITALQSGNYYNWVKHSNSAHFETTSGDKIIIAYGMQKIIEGYDHDWSASWEQTKGGFCWISYGDILISSH